MHFLCNFGQGSIRHIVSDTMLMLKFVILLKLCLNATMDIFSISQPCRTHADAASLLLYSKLGADKLASKKLRARNVATSEILHFVIKHRQLHRVLNVARLAYQR